MDMGTTNTRLWLVRKEEILATHRGAFGAGTSSAEGKQVLFDKLSNAIRTLLSEGKGNEREVSRIVASGMAGSELGILEVPHLPAPAGLAELAAGMKSVSVSEVTSIPFCIVPGLKTVDDNGNIADMMRGEETETMGLQNLCSFPSNTLLVLPGTHNKAILLENARIADFATSMSGELLSAVSQNTILRSAVSFDFALDDEALSDGCRMANEKGLGAALFHVRVMSKNEVSADSRSSFFFGAILSQDVKTIRTIGTAVPVYIGGRSNLKKALCVLLGENCREIPDDAAAQAVLRGLLRISRGA